MPECQNARMPTPLKQAAQYIDVYTIHRHVTKIDYSYYSHPFKRNSIVAAI